MIDEKKVALAIASGLSFVCATCRRFWEGQERGTKCTAVGKCGSPLCGDTFSEYDGPMASTMHLWCFVCGRQSDFGIRAKGKQRAVGVCSAHVQYLEKYRPVGAEPSVFEVLESGKPSGLGVPRKKTLAEAIAETEAEWAESDT